MINTIEEFMNNAFVVHCVTPYEADQLLKVLANRDVRWSTGKHILEETHWGVYENETCYEVCNYGMQFADRECFREDDYIIIKFKDLYNDEKSTVLKNDLITQKYTYIEHEADFTANAPHHFDVHKINGEHLCHIDFQEGAIKESGVNGVMGEDLIAMVITRLEAFQNSEFKCRENACAITKLEEALMWLRKRTIGRENRGVEGTHTV